MKQFKHFALSSALAFLPLVAGAAPTLDTDNDLQNFFGSILDFINEVLIPLILGIAFLFFVYGVFQYFIAGGADEEKKTAGKSLITYAIIGFVVILVFWGIVNLLTSATGLDDDVAPTTIPTGPSIGGGGGRT